MKVLAVAILLAFGIPDSSCTCSLVTSDIRFILYTRNSEISFNASSSDLIVENGQFNKSQPTVFYMFGHDQTPQSTSVRAVVSAYLKRGDHNVVVVDWSATVNMVLYPLELLCVHSAAQTVTGGLTKMLTAGLQLADVRLVGHSLGALLGGRVGSNFRGDLPSLIALDPAGLFTNTKSYVTTDSAQFVQVIHTSMLLGQNQPLGHADFYPNGGMKQRGCGLLDIKCSHRRAWQYFAESVENTESFIGSNCRKWNLFLSNQCNNNKKAVMGFATPTSTRGIFYLKTGSERPFGLGAKGVIA